jgi:hypothetical protein
VAIPGFYVWEVPGKPVSIQISLDVVDRLQQDVIRGFGAVPRRGAEVGGILLGTASSGGSVRIEQYELIPIEYKRGPSYLLSPEDVEAFEASLNDLRKGSAVHPVGYFRSHTRDGVGLGDEDRELLGRYFPEPGTVALLIRPFGTKPSIAGFYFKEDAEFQSGPPLLEFPFRRKDLAPDEEAPAQPAPERPRLNNPPRVEAPRAEPEDLAPQSEQQPAQPVKRWPIRNPPSDAIEDSAPVEPLQTAGLVPAEPELKAKPRRGWILPLSFIFLLLGLALGFQAGLVMRLHTQGSTDPYSVSLTVTQSGSDLQLAWDRQSPAIRAAKKGILTIEDGAYSKPTDLGAGELQSGSVVIYRPVTSHVTFHLVLFVKEHDSLSETVEWKQ